MILNLLRLLRYIIGWIDFILFTLLLYPLSFLPTAWTKHFFPALFKFWCHLFVDALYIQLKLHQKNRKNLPKHYIVISNHPSAFEDIGMPALFNARFLAKHELQSWWIVGKIAKAGGTLFVQRESKESRQKAAQKMHDTLKAGYNIGVYPEGGCKGRRICLPFRHGVFELSLQSNTPILPVFLHYEAQEDFEWHNQHLLIKIWQIMLSKNRTANYYVYDALYPEQFKTKEEYCAYVQELFLHWQNKYLD